MLTVFARAAIGTANVFVPWWVLAAFFVGNAVVFFVFGYTSSLFLALVFAWLTGNDFVLRRDVVRWRP